MTLQAIIERHHASEPLAISRSACLTPRGHCVQAAYRFLRILRELDASDRAIVLDMLRLELDGGQPA